MSTRSWRFALPVLALTSWTAEARAQELQQVDGVSMFQAASTIQPNRHVSGAGDVNQDGFADFIVGDQWNDSAKGSARVVSGLDGTVLHTFVGDEANNHLGMSVSGAGDVDQDGHADLVVGVPFFPAGGAFLRRGMVRVLSGLDGSVLHEALGDAQTDNLGLSVRDAGDVNADGYPDLIAGAPFADVPVFNAGRARVYSGEWIARTSQGLTPVSSEVLHTFSGPAVSSNNFGRSVDGAGDVNGDGFADLVVGSGGAFGGMRVYSGQSGALLHAFAGDATSDAFGWSVAGAGDVNGDGYDDVIAGAPKDDNTALTSGMARVFSGEWIKSTAAGGTPVTSQVLREFNGVSALDELGYCVDGVGDVNGDGFDDVAAGAPFDDDGGSNSGSVTVFSGASGAVLWKLDGPQALGNLGVSLSGAGDANGNGLGDIVGAAPYADSDGLTDNGITLLWSGQCGTVTQHGVSCAGSGGFTPQMTITGCPTPLATIDIGIEGALGGAFAIVFLGFERVSVPFNGGPCELNVGPGAGSLQQFLFNLPGVGPGAGALSLPALIPPGTTGVPVSLQLFVQDPAGPSGVATSRAVEFLIQ